MSVHLFFACEICLMLKRRRDSLRSRRLALECLESRRLLAVDLGDAPGSTVAKHEAVGPTLGALRDAEDGFGTTIGSLADGGDDDGVFYGVLRAGQVGAVITVNVQNAPAGARLDAWIDFNRNTLWDSGEQIADDLPVLEGDNEVVFNIPATAADGMAYARFRLSTAGNLTPGDDTAPDGEVEDYYLPVARGDDALFSGQNAINFAAANAVAAADLDGDGDADLVTGNNTQMQWHENIGGAFAPPMFVGSFAGARVTTGDIDGDGDVDVLAANLSGAVRWFKNAGNQTFTSQLLPLTATVVDLGDLDGDGDLDLFSNGPLGLAVHDNLGNGQWSSTSFGSDLASITAIEATDLDGDGDLDIFAADSAGGAILWIELGDDAATRHIVSSSATAVRTATPTDVDGDGDFDVVASVGPNGDLLWYENVGVGEFAAHLVSERGAIAPLPVRAADIDGDGDLDLLGGSFGSPQNLLTWYENDGAESFTPRPLFALDNAADAILADADGDGRLDVVAVRGALVPQFVWQRQLAAMDYGDAPAPYPTSAQYNGARHNAVGPRLGELRDSELDGARSDDAAASDDDDGVTFGEVQAGDFHTTVTIEVQNAPEGARLDAWIDFNGDGAWNGLGEQIAASWAVVEGENVVTFAVPSWAQAGTTYARFRLSTAGGAGLTGAALDGEVEDHALTVLGPVASSGHFGPAIGALGLPTNGHGIAIADFDGDGDGDLLGTSGVLWHENRGAEGFIPHAAIGNPTAYVATDFDGDGDPDIVSGGGSQVSWLENDGRGAFTPHVVSLSGILSSVERLTVADMDADGDQDIVVTEYFTRVVYILENTGEGRITPRAAFFTPLLASAIIAADVNGDGDLDLVVGGNVADSTVASEVLWYENDGRMGFGASVGLRVPVFPRFSRTVTDLAAADLDGDGDLDLAATSASTTPQVAAQVSWFENLGDGWHAHDLPNAAGGQSIGLADIDGDGDVDILASGNGVSTVFENDGRAGFAARTIASSTSTLSRIVAGDLDGDHDLDLFVTNRSGSAWFENLPLSAPDYGDAPAPYGTLRANNGAEHNAGGPRLGATRAAETDGTPSAAADAAGDDDGVTFGPLRPGDAAATVTLDVHDAPAGARVDAWVDFNGDGAWGGGGEHVVANAAVIEGENAFTFVIPGMAKAGQTFARVRISTAGGHGPTGFAADGEVEDYAVTIETPGETSGEYAAFRRAFGNATAVVRMADIDGDGDIDAVSDNATGPALQWYENLGDGAFLGHQLPTGSSAVTDIQVVDVDRDGDMDFIAVALGNVLWYENNGAESFRRRVIATGTFSNGASVEVVDMDQDGDWDVLTGSPSGVAWLVNNGQQSFTRQLLGPPTAIQKVRGADLDGDGDLDLVATGTSLHWLENRGGAFVPNTLTTGLSRDVLPADFDGDGDVDIVAVTGATISWFENVGEPAFVPHLNVFTGASTSSANSQGQLAVVDADGDGDLDVLFSGFVSPRLMVNDGAGNYVAQTVGPATGQSGSSTIIAVADINGDGRLEIVVGGQASQSGWYEALPWGDYDRNGRVDEADRLLWEQTTGQPATPPGSGADGDRDGDVDDDDLAVWEQHQGGQLIPTTSPANADVFQSEVIDGHDFLLWQRAVGLVAPEGIFTHWDGFVPGVSVVDGGDLEIWKRQYGQGVSPDAAWIYTPAGETAMTAPAGDFEAPAATRAAPAATTESPADERDATMALPENVILALGGAAASPSRSAYAPRARTPRDAAAAADAVLALRNMEPAVGRRAPQCGTRVAHGCRREPLETRLADEAFAAL